MTAEQLENFLAEAGIARESILIRDARYVFPQQDWLFGAFAAGLFEMRLQFGLSKWEAEDSDCDDFAELAGFYARFLHRRSVTAGRAAKGTAVAFGTFQYLIEDNLLQAHAINCAVVFESGAARLVFMEPQSGKRVDLSHEEVCSCFGVLF